MSGACNRRPILVLGIGNILLRDEGVGVRVIEQMQKLRLPDDVELVDGGTAGADLLDVLAERRKVIVIDAVQADCEPGTVLRFTADDLVRPDRVGMSLHELGLGEALAMTRQLGCVPEEVVSSLRTLAAVWSFRRELPHRCPRLSDWCWQKLQSEYVG